MRSTQLMNRWFWFVLLCFFMSAVPAFGVDKIDTEFGTNGFAVKDFGLGDDEALALAVQPDGKFLVAGYTSNGAVMNMAVARYLPEGILDISFNYDGVFILSMGSGDSLARAIVVQDDGTIVVAGSSFDIEPRLAVITLTSDGYLDMGFGDNGQVVLPVEDEEIITADIKVADDGSIIVGATIGDGDSGRYPLFAKISSNGEFDRDFGEEGTVRHEQDYDIEIRSLTLVDGEKLLVTGSIEKNEIMQAGLLRRNSDGTPDLTFGSQGELLLEIEGNDSVVNDLWLEPDGSVLIAGAVKIGEFHQAFAARLDTDGSLDHDFAGKGLFRSNLEYENVAYGITVQQDGTIVLAGFSSSGQGKDMIVWSIPDNDWPVSSGEAEVILNAEQQIILRELSLTDTSAQIPGIEDSEQRDQLAELAVTKIVTDIGSEDDVGYAVAALDSGQVLTAGSSRNGTDKDFVLVRYTGEDRSAASAAGDSAGGVTSEGYRVTTGPVGDITRVSAVTGGTVSDTRTLSCETSCTAECKESATQANCYASCLSECQARPTVVLRGVVYSVSQNPVYDDGGEEIVVPEPLESPDSPDTPDSSSDYFVSSGQTEDGSEVGSYVSKLLEITPDTTYYVRAYAVLSDDTVIYGDERSFKTDDACFIATAAYGTSLDRHVVLLREFRDTYLVPSSLGRKFVGVYYHFSPAIADTVSESRVLRGMVQVALWPLTLFALLMLKTTPAIKFSGVLVILLVAGFYLRKKQIVAGMKNHAKRLLTTRPMGEAGFTLIELLVVLVIIGILAGYIGPKIMGHPEEAKRTKATIQIQGIETALKMYKLDNGSYPSTEQGLQALVEPPSAGTLPAKWREGGYLEKGKVPSDPWGNEFIYLSPGINGDFDLSSYAIDGEAGGEGDAKDINSWEIE